MFALSLTNVLERDPNGLIDQFDASHRGGARLGVALRNLDATSARRWPGVQSWPLSHAPTFGHRFWLAVRPTTIPT